MNKVIWIIIIAIIVIGGYFWWQSAQAPAPTDEGLPEEVGGAVQVEPGAAVSEELGGEETPGQAGLAEKLIVSYTDSGFDPTEVTVAVGDAVVFRNGSNEPMWIASAPHPTHTDYPEFDAKSGYAPGDEYTFTFTQAGTWEYYNHLNIEHTGTVVVTE